MLQANGCEVVVPAGQVCCGALAAHAGMRDVARELAQTNFGAFGGEEVDAIVTNAAGCGSTLKEYSHLFDSASAVGADATTFSEQVRDVTEFLDQLGITAPMREVPLRVTIQDSCHLLHGQKVREAPRRLLRSIPGVQIVEMTLADQCCGSAGVYNVTGNEGVDGFARRQDDERESYGRDCDSHRESPAASCNSAPAPLCTKPVRKFCTL